ncbi:transcriptional regulator, AraC family [Parvibaculum lavamentivorans DS-1]|uniref:Transcriptional regulator, AraC family n=1 Tax=Parvibaculum lavamentivorans (strain DS-1 / DSM 13023 / NCIMB 13966) TaxID=402881 RepID=A7HQA8_PARL1|nr:DJ-1/PfpI family protein [Parvibaculum lavamentivorans]ABS62091.1 transcriptional regulator, AraC family [Parvibaculum lavamentivorans DS-1]
MSAKQKKTPPPAAPRCVMMVIYDGAQVLDVAGPVQLLSAATFPDGRAAYEIELVAEKPGPVATTSGLLLMAARGFADIPPAALRKIDTLMVTGGLGSRVEMENRHLLAFVRAAAAPARRVVSICTGAVILAAAGLLDGRRATTHWAYAPTMRRRFPKVAVEEDAIYVRDGKFWTSAGVTAGMDLALALVEEDLGREMALALARHHVMYLMRPGGQSQFSAQLAAQHVEDERLARVCAFVIENPRADLTVPALAARAVMSERSFARHFVAETGFTPAQFVERARLDEACRRLANGDHSLDAVSADAGFGAAERMRRAFIRHLGVTPGRYRERFRTARRDAPRTFSPLETGNAHLHSSL